MKDANLQDVDGKDLSFSKHVQINIRMQVCEVEVI